MVAHVSTRPLDVGWPDPASVRADGTEIGSQGTEYLRLISEAHSTWTSGIDQHFHQPGSQVEAAKDAYEKVVLTGAAVSAAAASVKDALVAYGDAVEDLQGRRENARQRAEAINRRIDTGEEVTPAERNAVQQEADGVGEDLDRVKQTCASALSAVTPEFKDNPVVASELARTGITSAGYVMDELRFHDVTYVQTTRVTTITDPTIVNKLGNMQAAFEIRPGWWTPALVVDVPGRTTATSLDVEELLRTRSTLSLPATAGWLDRAVGAASGGRVPSSNRQTRVVTDETVRARQGGLFSRDGARTTTHTRVTVAGPDGRMPVDAPETTRGAAGVANQALKYGGRGLLVFGVVTTAIDEGREAEAEVNTDPKYAHLTTEEKQQVAGRRQTVATITNTGVDLAAGATGAVVGGMIGGPLGAAVGFGLGVGLSWASDQKWFGVESAKEHLSDGVNGVFE